ncbi:hypothetical protein OS189_15415 [Sulfitobacter sp. F26169L]|uniref:hypothetical protein n=1 Tax=Sulfitobacter sp. F26169L TaxID=2996015 RepID=UPI002260D6CD|nr:hypothetical protein [Sulfitobacter sp. F26169L]MCX7567733.1 hypothetical protein [Sulfitobacter sp. F26169L]
MPKNINIISIDAAARFAKKLADAPAKEKTSFSAREVVQMNKDAILQAVNEQGYSFQEIAEWLSEEGAKLSVSTLRSYLRDPKKRIAKTGARAKTKPKGNQAITPQNKDLPEKGLSITNQETDVSPLELEISLQEEKQRERIDAEKLFNKFGGTEGRVV